MAPEMYFRNSNRGPKLDVWSATVVIYIILTMELPFSGFDNDETINQVLNKNIDLNQPKYELLFSNNAKEFLELGLKKITDDRGTAL